MPKGIDAKSAESRLLRFARTPQGAARFGAGVLAILQDLHAVDENVFHPDRVLMRLLESRAIGNRRRIEHNDIGKHSFLEKTAMIETEIRRGQCAQSAHRFGNVITFSSRTYLPSTRAKFP